MPTLRERFPIQRRKILKKSFVRVIGVLLISLLLSMIVFALFDAAAFDDRSYIGRWVEQHHGRIVFVWLSFVLLMVLYAPIYQWLYFRSYFYDMDERNVIIRKGIISRKELTLPLAKITDVSVDQDIFDVLLGLYDVHISTPTAESGKFAHIDGVNRKGAVQLRGLLLEKINESPK